MGIECPRCEQIDKVSTTTKAGVSPPAKPNPSWLNLVISGIFAVIISIIIMIPFGFHRWLLYPLGFGVVLIGIGFWGFARYYVKAMEKWEEKMADWRESWYCARCDVVFASESRGMEMRRSKGKQAARWAVLRHALAQSWGLEKKD